MSGADRDRELRMARARFRAASAQTQRMKAVSDRVLVRDGVEIADLARKLHTLYALTAQSAAADVRRLQLRPVPSDTSREPVRVRIPRRMVRRGVGKGQAMTAVQEIDHVHVLAWPDHSNPQRVCRECGLIREERPAGTMQPGMSLLLSTRRWVRVLAISPVTVNGQDCVTLMVRTEAGGRHQLTAPVGDRWEVQYTPGDLDAAAVAAQPWTSAQITQTLDLASSVKRWVEHNVDRLTRQETDALHRAILIMAELPVSS